MALRPAREFVRPSYRKSQLLELLASSTSSTQVHAEQRPHGSSPLIVLTAGYPNTAGTMTPAHQRAIWVAEVHVHDRIAALSSRGINFVVEGSGHHIPEERPVTASAPGLSSNALMERTGRQSTMAPFHPRCIPDQKWSPLASLSEPSEPAAPSALR